MILAKKCKDRESIVRWCDSIVTHSGRGITLNEMKTDGYWIIKTTSTTKSVLFKCAMPQPQCKFC